MKIMTESVHNIELQERFLDNVTEKDFMECLQKLNTYVLLPIGITNLFDNKKYCKMGNILAYLYPFLLFIYSISLLFTQTDGWLYGLDIPFQRNLLRIVFADYGFTSLSLYFCIKYVLFSPQKFQNAWKFLYQNITRVCNGNNNEQNELYMVFYNEIKRILIKFIIVGYIANILSILYWIGVSILGTFEEHTLTDENASIGLIIYNLFHPILFTYFEYCPVCALVIIFFLSVQSLKFRSYLLISRIYHTFYSKHYNDILPLQKTLNLSKMKKLSKYKLKSITINEIKKEYYHLVYLFKKVSLFWNIPFIIISINYIIQILQGFLFFYIGINNKIYLFSSFGIWLYGIIWILLYIFEISKLNNIDKEFKKIISLICLKYSHENDGLNNEDINRINLLLKFIDTNRISFEFIGIRIDFNLTIIIFTTAFSPLLSLIFTYFFKKL